MHYKKWLIIYLMILGLMPTRKADAFIIINEILADPPSGIAGDANKDGNSSSTQDEFVELLNTGYSPENISGWYLTDSINARHIFPANTSISQGEYWVVFGGGLLGNLNVHAQTASTGTLSLNNTGDTVSLFRQDQSLVDRVVYNDMANHDQSITRMPEGEGPFVLHGSIPQASGKLYSAGKGVDGSLRYDLGAQSIPEAPTSLYFLLGFYIFFIMRRHSFEMP